MPDILQLLGIPFLVALTLTGIHTYFGLHVLARNIVFVDLALAQISALGATTAFMLGHLPQSEGAYLYALAFTLVGAAMLSFTRHWTGRLSQETLIGVIYVTAAAAGFLLVDQAPQGAEHLKQILIGSLLTVSEDDLLRLLALYAAIGALHWVLRRRFLLLSFQPDEAGRRGLPTWLWDFLFYASFGVVVTSSVAVGGVLLVFSFLIVPAAIGVLYSQRLLIRLLVGWVAGALASLTGMSASYAWDLPTGAAIVCALALTLLLAAALKPLLFATAADRYSLRRRAGHLARRALAVPLLLSGLWLAFNPRADQPLLDATEYLYPPLRAAFLNAREEAAFHDADEAAARVRAEAQRLQTMERDSRWQGAELSDQELRRLTSYAQSFQEMEKGEQFVQRELRNRARGRQRWIIAIPLLVIGLALLLRAKRGGDLSSKSAPAIQERYGQ